MKLILYSHGGSKNHGCEAIVRTFAMESKACAFAAPVLVSMRPSEDKCYGVDDDVNVIGDKVKVNKFGWAYVHAYLMNKIWGKYAYLDCLPCKKVISSFEPTDIAFSIGGDNYSYHYDENHTYMHNLYRKKGMKTLLWACSINPDLLDDARILDDIKNYDCITVRESITYDAMIRHGVKNVHLIPDLAFVLPRQECDESKLIVPNKYVGINLSPMVMGYRTGESVVLDNYLHLISYVLLKTDYHVALIPHVVWSHNDDRKAMQPIYDRFKHTGRVVMIHDHNCMQLKDIIARCRFFIGARTHGTSAAYSTCVPTFVLGYSIKARGIAKDIFGTEDNYVIPVQDLKTTDELTKSFIWMQEHEVEIRNHLESFMPEYVEKVHLSRDILKIYCK